MGDSLMSDYLQNEEDDKLVWPRSLYNPFKAILHPSYYLTSIVDKTHHGPVVVPFSGQLLQLF